MNLEEWKQLCRKARENDYDYLRIDRFAENGEGRHTIRNCDKNTYTECTPETKPFRKHKTLDHTSTQMRVDHNRIFFKQSHSHFLSNNYIHNILNVVCN